MPVPGATGFPSPGKRKSGFDLRGRGSIEPPPPPKLGRGVEEKGSIDRAISQVL